jgi:hypothetical protein
VEKGKLDAAKRDEALSRIATKEAGFPLDACAIAIEAVPEKFEIKRDVFAMLDQRLPSEAILATNTSSISVTQLAAVTKRPGRFVGMHFMNPVPLMPLVEVVRGLDTTDATVAETVDLKVVPGNSENYYQEIQIPGGIRLKSAKVHQLLLETDVFINVPILKDHNSTRMTCCLKNTMGLVWDRGFWHKNDLHQCIADYALYEKKPTLNVIDCYNVMVKNGPQGVAKEDVVQMKSQILTTDWVAGDAAAAKMLGIDPEKIDYIPKAYKLGLGNMKLETLNIRRIKM